MQRSHLRKAVTLWLAIGMALVVIACGSKVKGTYSSNSGTMLLELRSGGKASFQMMGETEDCAYTVSGKKIHLACGKNSLDFTINDDGSITSNSPFIGATFGVLRKTK